MKLQQALTQQQDRLKDAGIDDYVLDVRLLFCHALKCERVDLLSKPDRILDSNEMTIIETLIARRCNHEPVARIIGSREFWGLSFDLNEATLDPRPDSETLIEAVLAQADKTVPLRILDLGTGTGCLLLALLSSLEQATGLGVDISARAVEQARSNADKLGLSSRVIFQEGSWLDTVTGAFDIIVSNPPYIPSFTIETLAPEVKDYDPSLALDGGADGLDPYRHLIPLLPSRLKTNGFVALEVGQHQAVDVCSLLQKNGLTDVQIYADLNNIPRTICARCNRV